MDYSYVPVAYTILESKDTKDREYRALEQVKRDNYPKYLFIIDSLIQKKRDHPCESILSAVKEPTHYVVLPI